MKAPDDFLSQLEKTGTGLRKGYFTSSMGKVAAGLLLLVVAIGITDYVVGWEVPMRQVFAWLVAALILGGSFLAWRRAVNVPLPVIATRADLANGDPRREVSAALDIANGSRGESKGENGSLHDYLSGLLIERAAGSLAGLPPERLFSRSECLRAWRIAAWTGAALLILALFHPRATAVIANRLFQPSSELPPYSPYRFTPVEEVPRVVFGKEASLAMEIEGPPFSGDVELLVRPLGGGKIDRLPTFRETSTRYSRKLDGVTAPVEFAFSMGRARSAWYQLEVIYQPRLEGAAVVLSPPAYSRLPESRFSLGAEDLRGLRGTRVSLVAESNRPLSGGVLEGRAPQGREVVQRVEAEAAMNEDKKVTFEWEIDADLVWTLDLTDIRGGRMEETVNLAQRLIPDEKPVIDLVEPGPFIFATPESEVKLAWEVEDDLGLDRVEWLRSAERFRDRVRSLPEGAGEKRVRIERSTLLGNLGVKPGQTLEFLLEARDRNPSLLGIGTSPAANIRIISEEEYGAQIRLRTTLEEFSGRYEALREKLRSAQTSLEALAEAARSGDSARTDAARATAIQAQEDAAEWFKAFASDFPAFATDKGLNELSGDLHGELQRNLSELRNEKDWSDPEKAAALANALKERLDPGVAQLEEQSAAAAEITTLGAVMEMAAELEAIHEEQRDISHRLDRIARELALGRTDSRGDLPSLRARQRSNHERLAEVEQKLAERLPSLPASAESLRSGAEKVLEMLGELQVGKQMADSASQAGEGKVPGAAEDAALALANLDQILAQQKNDFSSICQGGEPGFCTGEGVAEQTLAQMLEALRGRSRSRTAGNGGTGGAGGGSGIGGLGGSGTTMQGIQLDIPLIGPARVILSRPPGGMGGRGKDPGGTSSSLRDEATAGALPAGETEAPQGRAWTPEDIPPKYRDAVGRFFSEASEPVSSEPDPAP